MFALPLISMIFGKLKWVILIGVVLGAGWAYYEWSRAEINSLKSSLALVQKQADDLKLTNDHILADIVIVQREQQKANVAISDARQRSQQSQNMVRQQGLSTIAKTQPKTAETQLNSNTATTFKGFEDASH